MRIIDISLPLYPGMLVWPGDTRFTRKESRGTAIVSKLVMSSHTGTHIDAPKHFLFEKSGVDSITLKKLIGKCQVVEINVARLSENIRICHAVLDTASRKSDKQAKFLKPGFRVGARNDSFRTVSYQIKAADFAKVKIKAGDKILFKTPNSKLLKKKKFTSDYVSLSLDAAKYLVSKQIDLVGIDYFGIESKGAAGHLVHKTLLRAGIVIVEGLDLSKVKAGKYNLVALPLKIKSGDGAPARVMLWR